MVIAKSILIAALRAVKSFDPLGSPFIGVQWGSESILFHRSSSTGYIQSEGYASTVPDAIASLQHLLDTLALFDDIQVDVIKDRQGGMLIRSAAANLTELHVHTLRPNVTWGFAHEPGIPATRLDPTAFHGINTSPFVLASSPVLRAGKLMLITNFGCVMRTQMPVSGYPYPRESLLRILSTIKVSELSITDKGYWLARGSGFEAVVSGHRLGDPIFDLYNRGADPIAEFPAARLTHALGASESVVQPHLRIRFDATTGISVVDAYGQTGKFALGSTGEWESFSIPPGTAKIMEAAFRQGTEETIVLGRVNVDTLRFSRGCWEVSFKYFPSESTSRQAGR